MSQSDFLLLHQYISSNSIPRVKSLLKSKRIKVSDYDPYDTDLSPLLFYAIKYATDDNGELLDYFLENNNDIGRMRDSRRRTCLLYAIECENKIAMEKVLAHHSAAMMCGTPDKRGMTPILLSCQLGLYPVVERLIEIGALIDEADKDGSTPLHYAASYGYTDIAALLMAKGADSYIENAKGWSPMDYSYSNAVHEYIKNCQQAIVNGVGLPAFSQQSTVSQLSAHMIPQLSSTSFNGKSNEVKTLIKEQVGIGSRANSVIGPRSHLATTSSLGPVVSGSINLNNLKSI